MSTQDWLRVSIDVGPSAFPIASGALASRLLTWRSRPSVGADACTALGLALRTTTRETATAELECLEMTIAWDRAADLPHHGSSSRRLATANGEATYTPANRRFGELVPPILSGPPKRRVVRGIPPQADCLSRTERGASGATPIRRRGDVVDLLRSDTRLGARDAGRPDRHAEDAAQHGRRRRQQGRRAFRRGTRRSTTGSGSMRRYGRSVRRPLRSGTASPVWPWPRPIDWCT